MLVRAISGLTVTPKKPTAASGLVVLTAASGDQFASWDEDAKHGLFTLHLLKALAGTADGKDYGDGDGKVTLAEVKRYLDDEMTYQARRRFGRIQLATVQGDGGVVLARRGDDGSWGQSKAAKQALAARDRLKELTAGLTMARERMFLA